MAELMRSKNYEKNHSYDEGYKRGMEDAVRQGYAHASDEVSTNDIKRMLTVIHNENLNIMRMQLMTATHCGSETARKSTKFFDDAFYGKESDSE